MPEERDAQVGAVTEEHKKFEPFVGTFRAEVKMWMGPGEPMVVTGKMVNTLELGGRFLQQVYTGDPCEGPFPNFEGRGYWGFNTVTKKYEGFWIDTVATFMQTDAGHVDDTGKTWTMVGQFADPQSDDMVQKRSVIELQDNDHHSIQMFMTKPGGDEFKVMEINYQRAE